MRVHLGTATLPLLLVTSLLLAGCELLNGGDEQPPDEGAAAGPSLWQPVEAEAQGVTVRLADVEYAGTSTLIRLVIVRPEDVFARIGYYYRPAFGDELRTQGFEGPAPEVTSVSGGATGGIDFLEYRLGPVADRDEPVVFEVRRLCTAPSGSPGECVDGPWRFEWVPGRDAGASAVTTLTIDETQTANGYTLHLEDVHISDAEVVVRVWSELPEGALDLSPFLQLRLPDGTAVPGEGGGASSDDPPRTLRTWRFPPLPDGVRTFEVMMESFLVRTPQDAAFEFSMAGRLEGVDVDQDALTDVPIGEDIVIDGQTLRLTHVQVGFGNLDFFVRNVTDGARTIHFGEPGTVTLRDVDGQTYPLSGAGGDYAGQTHFRFWIDEPAGLGDLELATHSVMLLLEPPEPFEVQLP